MEHFSYSKISAFIECPKKFYWRYVEHLRPKRKSPALALGSCMAYGLAEYRRTGSQDGARKAFVERWEEEGRILEKTKDADPLRSVARGLEILSEYMQSYPDDPTNFVRPEVTFEDEVAPGIIFQGRLDGVVRLDDGTMAVNEDKTASRWGDSYFRKLHHSYQVLWYLWIAKKLGLFDLGKKSSPKCVVRVIYIHRQSYKFPSDLVIKSSRQVEDAFKEMLQWIKLIQRCVADNHFPKGDAEICLKYGGCDYLPLRGASQRLKDSLIEHEYERKEEDEEEAP